MNNPKSKKPSRCEQKRLVSEAEACAFKLNHSLGTHYLPPLAISADDRG